MNNGNDDNGVGSYFDNMISCDGLVYFGSKFIWLINKKIISFLACRYLFDVLIIYRFSQVRRNR